MNIKIQSASAEARTAYDVWEEGSRVRVADNGDHIAIMSFREPSRFMRINISREDFHRLAVLVPAQEDK